MIRKADSASPKKSVLYSWNASNGMIAVFTGVFILLISSIFFTVQLMNPAWVIYSVLMLVIFFSGISYSSGKINIRSEKEFLRWLFFMTLLLRLFYIIFLFTETNISWGMPFYVGAKDEIKYDRVGEELATLIRSGRATEVISHVRDIYEGIDDIGFPTLIGLIYTVFGRNLVIGRIIMALFGSYAVILIYKTALLFWETKIARFAAILAMWFPLSLFYNSVYLKEGLLVMMIMIIIYKTSRWIKENHISAWNFALIVLVITAIFLFRTALGALMFLVVLGSIVFTRYRGSVVLGIFIALIFLIVFYFTLNLLGESKYFENQLMSGDEYGTSRLEHISKINKLAVLGSIPFFLSIAFFAPFPTLISDLNLSYTNQPHGTLDYQVPGVLVWNLLAFFAIYGLIYTLRNNRRETFAIWAFSIGYTLLLVKTSLFTSVRFAYCGLPIMMIFASVGISKLRKMHFWYMYLFLAAALVIGWNFFKVAGRGLL